MVLFILLYARSWGEEKDKPKMDDGEFGVLEAVTIWADIIHELKIAVFY